MPKGTWGRRNPKDPLGLTQCIPASRATHLSNSRTEQRSAREQAFCTMAQNAQVGRAHSASIALCFRCLGAVSGTFDNPSIARHSRGSAPPKKLKDTSLWSYRSGDDAIAGRIVLYAHKDMLAIRILRTNDEGHYLFAVMRHTEYIQRPNLQSLTKLVKVISMQGVKCAIIRISNKIAETCI